MYLPFGLGWFVLGVVLGAFRGVVFWVFGWLCFGCVFWVDWFKCLLPSVILQVFCFAADWLFMFCVFALYYLLRMVLCWLYFDGCQRCLFGVSVFADCF